MLSQIMFKKTESVKKFSFPILTFITFLINVFFIIYKGTPQLNLDEISLTLSINISITISLIVSLFSYLLYVPYAKNKIKERNQNSILDTNSVINDIIDEDDIVYNKDITVKENITNLKKYIDKLKKKEKQKLLCQLYTNADKYDDNLEYLCSNFQVITACFSSFAHGANDVANSIATFATIYSIYLHETVSTKTQVPIWLLLMGGIGIVSGLATWGYKIIDRIGSELTKITASRGFIIELSASLTILLASRLEMPVSTTHCQVGSIIGCGIGDNKNNIKWKYIKNIILSWVVTLPVTGLISAAIFSFAIYSP